MKKPFLSERAISSCPFFLGPAYLTLRRRTIMLVVRLFLRVL
jgi:hypothetical protein